MVDPKNGWLLKGICSATCVLVGLVLVTGCAGSSGSLDPVAKASAQMIQELNVARSEEASIIRLEGLAAPVFAVSSPEQEQVFVVDLVDVGAAGNLGLVDATGHQVAVYDGIVDVVSLSTYEDESGSLQTRLEVLMARRADAEIVDVGDALEIRVRPVEPMLAASVDDADWLAGEGEPEAVIEVSTPVGPPPTATELTGISTQETPDGVLLALSANGAIEAMEVFTVENPSRLVVDLPGIAIAESVKDFVLDSRFVSGVRVGAHDGKARVVVDGGSQANDFSGRRVAPGQTGLWVAIGEGEALSSAMADALANDQASWAVASLQSDAAEGAITEALDSPAEGAEMGADLVTLPDESKIADAGEPVSDGAVELVSDAAVEPELIELAAADAGVVEQVSVEVAERIEPDGEIEAGVVAEFDSTEGMEVAEIVAPPVDQVEGEILAAELAQEPAEVPDWGGSEAEAPVAASLSGEVEEVELGEIFGLHYERSGSLDRTAILSEDVVLYTVSEPDETTFVVSILNSRISPAASDRIFPAAGGPISLIHAFQQPEVEIPEVRVVFKRAPGQEPIVSRRGSMLFVDFEDVGIAAAPPPAFPEAGAPVEAGVAVVAATTEVMASESVDVTVAENPVMEANPVPAAQAVIELAPVTIAPVDLPEFEIDPALAALTAEDPMQAWEVPATVPASPAAVEVPAAIEVLEEGGLIDGKEYRGRRVSLDFKDVEIADVLRLIAEVSDLNIIAGDEVSGNVTIRLVEVPWDQALDVILMTKGLGFVRVGNVLRIAPSDVLKAEEEVRLQERRNKEKLEDLEVKLLPVNYAAVRDTEGLVKRLLSARGTVNLDERTNTLIIKDISSVIDEATALIAAIDTQTPQVMIEAKIVEANLDFSRELGSVWGIQTQQFQDPFDPTTPRQDLGSEDLTFIDDNSLAFANPISAVPNGLLSVGALILNQDFKVNAQIQAAESTGDGKVVSSPRIVTLDNKEAKIEQGVSIPFQTFEGGDAKLEFVDAVLSLIVTPHITADESIIMEIEVTRNAPDTTIPTTTGSPAIAKNVAETETLVKDGQTLVLGGIYTITKSKTQSRIPYLHRIPVIGNAFKNNAVTDQRKELLVFVTPRIVRLPEMASN